MSIAAPVIGCLLGAAGALLGMHLWRQRQRRRLLASMDHLLMLLDHERARCVELGADVLVPPLETIIGSVTRVRVGIAEGRLPDGRYEAAAMQAADEQIRMIGGLNGDT